MNNIVFVTQNLNAGGAEKVLSVLANYFANQAYKVSILMISPDAGNPFYEIDKRISIFSIYNNEHQRISKLKKIKIIKKHLTEIQPDYIIPFLDFVTIYTYFACRKLRSKLIVSERCDPSEVSFLERILKAHIYKKADGCVFQTRMAKEFYGNKIRKYKIIHNPVFLNEHIEFDYVNNDRKHEIVMVGSAKKEKNREMAYKGFEKLVHSEGLNDYVLKIYGESTKEKDNDLLQKLGVENKVLFMGKVKNWHKESINSTAFILCSNFEGMPNALLEAASLKIPCISTDCPVGGPNIILDNGSKGILIKVNDHLSLGDSLIKLASSKELQNRLSDANKDTKAIFDKEYICQQWKLFLSEL